MDHVEKLRDNSLKLQAIAKDSIGDPKLANRISECADEVGVVADDLEAGYQRIDALANGEAVTVDVPAEPVSFSTKAPKA